MLTKIIRATRPPWASKRSASSETLLALGSAAVSTSLNVQNLFDREYVSSCNYSFGCYYGQQRTASLEVKYDW